MDAKTIDWQFLIGDVLIPIAIFVAGCFLVGCILRATNRSKNKSTIKGSNNNVSQGNIFMNKPDGEK